MKKEQINEILGIRESFELPEKLMGILLNPLQRIDTFNKFMSIGEELDHDWFTEYFEEQHANKDRMMQDFTPSSVCKLLALITRNEFNSCCDICSGTGGLTISMWNKNPNAYYHTEEYSQRAFPLLLFNMAIRNIDGEAYLMDVLKQDVVMV